MAVDADFAVHKYTPRSEDSKDHQGILYQLGTETYSLPENLAPFVGHINPGNDFRTSFLPSPRVPHPPLILCCVVEKVL